jgi:hypothetical protein
MSSARQLLSANCARLKATFSGRWILNASSASDPPASCAEINPNGDAKKSPKTSPASLSERLCASLRK